MSFGFLIRRFFVWLGLAMAAPVTAGEVWIAPERLELTGWGSRAQIVVSTMENGRHIDLTRAVECSLEMVGPPVVTVDDRRCVTAVADGSATLVVSVRGVRREIPVVVKGVSAPPPVDFEQDVQPILTRFGCNAGTCHGKQRGQNGFQLSLLGFDAGFDYDALTKEGRGRRAFSPVPDQSLLLLKPVNAVPHGGGKRLEPGGPPFEVLRRWLADGAPRRAPGASTVQRIAVEPTQVVLSRKGQHQLRVTATYADGSTRDVTALTAFQSSDAVLVAVDERGLMTAGQILGDAAVMARYQGHIAVCTVVAPHPDPAPEELYASLPVYNAIDAAVWRRLRQLGITPSAAAEEHTVLRRLYLDLIGRGPTAEEARQYLEDGVPDKRAKLIDRLLHDPEYAEHWANKWTDLLRPNPYRVGIKATLNYDAWIREAFRRNLPYDQFVRELLTAQGSTFRHGATTLYRDRRSPDEITTLVSQLFLGIRLECAKCHHHPFEVYGQDDFYSFAAYFAQLGRKGTGLSPPISGSEEFLFAAGKGSVTHPLTGAVMTPRPLFGSAPALEGVEDPRVALAAWMTSPENPYFAKTIANRVWADLMGRGLVEPVDDLRATNPPSNPELLDVLANELRSHGFDLKQLVRFIASSYVYGLSSLPNERNAADQRSFSRHYRQRLRAEVLFDTLCQVTGHEPEFDAMPPGSRAKELWTARIPSLFLDAFSRQDPNQDPPCERATEPTIVQALHLMNSEKLMQQVMAEQGRAARLAASDLTPKQIVEELYLSVFARFPTEEEATAALSYFPTDGSNRRMAVEDLMWALVNTAEFVFED
jgi:hypothetical protein